MIEDSQISACFEGTESSTGRSMMVHFRIDKIKLLDDLEWKIDFRLRFMQVGGRLGAPLP